MQMSSKGIFIASPAYGGVVQTGYFQSVVTLAALCWDRKLAMTLALTDKESLITRARNYLVGKFLLPEFAHCDVLLFIDTDITFQAKDVLTLYDHCCSI